MKYHFSFIFSLLFLQIAIASEEPNYSFSRITPEGGFVNSEITCIVEDNLGVIWFGTKNGLYNYNSIEIKEFKHTRGDLTTIPSNRIRDIYKDSSGKLWISTNDGICQYNPQKRNFRQLNIKDSNNQNIKNTWIVLFEDNNHTFWFSNRDFFGTLDLEDEKAHIYNIGQKQNEISQIKYNEQDHSIWVFYTDGEIYVKKKDEKDFKLFTTIPDHQVYTVLFVKDNIWISFAHHGVICLSADGNIQHQYNSKNPSEEKRLPHDNSRNIIQVKENTLWVATYEGIAVIEDFQVKNIVQQEKYPIIPHHSIWSLFKDSQNNIWVGTWKGGLCFHNGYNSQFQHYNVSSSNNSINDNYINCIIGIPNSNGLLIGTQNGGINKYDLNTNKFSQLPIYYNNERIKNIKSLAFDPEETLWIGSHNDGIFYKKKGSNVFKRLIPPFPEGIQAFHLQPTKNGIWVCNYPNGVYFYNFTTQEFKEFHHDPMDIHSISSNKVRQIYIDSESNLWFATEQGLNLLKKGTSEFIHFFYHKDNPKSISGDFIFAIAEDTNGNIWVGTNGYGLNKINIKTLEAEHFTTDEGIPGNEIYTIIADSEHHFWIATDHGLCRFNPYSYEVQSYSDKEDFTMSFLPASAFTKNGQELFFGGSNGFIRFAPGRILKNPNPPKVNINDLLINNETILPNTINGILKKEIWETTFIKLNYKQNTIGFRIINNNYINPKKNKYKYRLIGLSNNWIYTDWLGKVDFYNLSPGLYTFEVMAGNNSGVWSNESTKIRIRITPPWWFSWYAYTAYTLLFIFIIYWYRKVLINRHKLIAEVEVEKVKNQSNEQIHQMKLQFFTNISHEFRTPLTLIRGPLKKLIKNETKPESAYLLNLINSNTNRLLLLVNQFLDFRKAETGNTKLKLINDDIVSFSQNIFSVFKFLAEQQSIEYSFQSEIENLSIDFDAEKLDKVLYNLLSNAFKHTPENGTISVKVDKEEINKSILTDDSFSFVTGDVTDGTYVSITVFDSGCGISHEILPNIFNRYFVGSHDKSGGTGIGLALCERYVQLHNGCIAVKSSSECGATFKVYLPIKQNENLYSTYSERMEKLKPLSDEYLKERFNKEFYVNKDLTVLIAEDNLELQTYLGNTLSDYYKVIKAKNGEFAFEQALTLFPDIVLSDIMMPIMDGIELCQKLKTDIRTSHIPVILLTALDTIKDRIKGISTGADAYISKPFNDELLIAQIHNLIKSRKELRELFSSHESKWEEKMSPEGLDRKFLRKAIQITEDSLLDTQFSVESLAEKLYISRTHLHRKLKSLTDQSATEFIRFVRLKHAVRLMKDGKYKINEVGYAVGFNSHHYFTKSFKKQYGVSPSEFMRKKDF
jgi:signal transduction histidine kinase/DNA-binding response OmpR family regulator/streptogramin lyase